jgi:hypothetical protein
MTKIEELIERLEKATGPSRELSDEVAMAVGWNKAEAMFNNWFAPDGRHQTYGSPPHYTKSIDDAMTLLPESACNIDISSFVGHGRKDIGETAWGVSFHDQAQLVGTERAKAQVARLIKGTTFESHHRGAPVVTMEKALAEHFCQFSGTHTPNAAIALCIAALRARALV